MSLFPLPTSPCLEMVMNEKWYQLLTDLFNFSQFKFFLTPPSPTWNILLNCCFHRHIFTLGGSHWKGHENSPLCPPDFNTPPSQRRSRAHSDVREVGLSARWAVECILVLSFSLTKIQWCFHILSSKERRMTDSSPFTWLSYVPSSSEQVPKIVLKRDLLPVRTMLMLLCSPAFSFFPCQEAEPQITQFGFEFHQILINLGGSM